VTISDTRPRPGGLQHELHLLPSRLYNIIWIIKIKTYSDEEIRNVASKYERKDLFLKNEPSIVQAARIRGMYDELVSNMEKNKYDTTQYVPPSENKVLSTAKQFTSVSSFRKSHPSFYNFAYKNNLLPIIKDFYKK
jgi:hypothetical protein